MHHVVSRLSVAALGALALAACGSSGPEQSGGPTVAPTAPPPSLAGLPFHYEATGESSSPTFHVAKAGGYTVAYVLKGVADQPSCTMTIVMVAQDGSEQQVVQSAKVAPSDVVQKSVPVTLAVGDWRFQEGGGCSWNVTVNAA